MNKIISKAIGCLLCASMLTMSSCIGSFTLTNRLLGWNNHIGNKFLNELVFFALWVLPVYEVCGIADVIILNSIEFWSGSNPVAKGEKIIDGKDGKYLVKCDGKGYDIISCNDGSKIRLDFDAETQSWNYDIAGQKGTLFTFVDENHVKLPVGDEWKTIEVSQAGVYAYQQMAMPAFAAK